MLRKTIRCLDHMTDAFVFLICILLFLIGLYSLYDSYMVYKGANDDSLLKYKPGYEGEAPDREIKGNMVAWLTLDDTAIDYPVMQGKTNDEYLNRTPYGDYSLSGSIFLDSRNSSNFTDEYSLIYGHHMDGGLMFGALDEYADKQYFNNHRTGTLTVGDVTYEIEVFAVLEALATNEYIFAPTEVNAADTLKYIKENALYFDEAVLQKKETILGMSTCQYPDTIGRTVVFGVLHTTH